MSGLPPGVPALLAISLILFGIALDEALRWMHRRDRDWRRVQRVAAVQRRAHDRSNVRLIREGDDR